MGSDGVLEDAVAQLRDGIEAFRAAGERLVGDESVVAGVMAGEAAMAALEHAWLGWVAELDRRPDAVPGARGGAVAASFLRAGLNRSSAQAKKDVAAAKAVAEGGLCAVGSAFAAGEVNRAHVDVAVTCLADAPGDVRASTEAVAQLDEFLAEKARQFDPKQLRAITRQLNTVLDPDRQEAGFDPESWRRRYLSLTEAPDGMTIIRGQVDTVSAVWLKTALGHFAAPTRVESAENGLPVEVVDDRSPGQRAADALTTMARKALDAEGSNAARREPPHVLVVATPEQLADAQSRPSAGERRRSAEREGRQAVVHALSGAPPPTEERHPPTGFAEVSRAGPVPPDVLAALTCDALLQAVVLEPDSGAVLNLGRTQRTASRAQRRALAARDGGCLVPGCPAPPSDCDAHHLRHWSAGGPTDLANLGLLCPRHHAEVHLGLWVVTVVDGLPVVQSPVRAALHGGRVPVGAPRRAAREARRLAQQLRLNLDPPSGSAA